MPRAIKGQLCGPSGLQLKAFFPENLAHSFILALEVGQAVWFHHSKGRDPND